MQTSWWANTTLVSGFRNKELYRPDMSSSDRYAPGRRLDTTPIVVYPDYVPVRRLFPKGRPLARFDSDGVECAAGRISWKDVERVALVEVPASSFSHQDTVWRLSVQLRAGAQPLPPIGNYDRGPRDGRAQFSEHALSLPLWASARSVLDTVRRFYDGPTTDVVTYDEPGGWPGEDIGSFTDDRERERQRKLKRLFPEPSDWFPRAELRRLGRDDGQRLIEALRADGKDSIADRYQEVFDALEREGDFDP
jgi:hypothetical protein